MEPPEWLWSSKCGRLMSLKRFQSLLRFLCFDIMKRYRPLEAQAPRTPAASGHYKVDRWAEIRSCSLWL